MVGKIKIFAKLSLCLVVLFGSLGFMQNPVSAAARAQVNVDQPCYFEHSYDLVNNNRHHGGNNPDRAVDLGANGVKPIYYDASGNMHVLKYQTCVNDKAIASVNGTITKVGYEAGGLGNFFVITSSTNTANSVVYGHMESIKYGEGTNVTVGQVVGKIGTSGQTTFRHIHFVFKINGVTQGYDAWKFGHLQNDPIPTVKCNEDGCPVYRFYSPSFNSHFLTSDVNEKDATNLNPAWLYEGLAFRVRTAGGLDLKKVHRFWDKIYQHHFYTASKDEYKSLLQDPGRWQYEGIAFYAGTPNALNGKKVYRFVNVNNYAHFYTISKEEREALESNPAWLYEGVAFYAWKV